METLGFELKSHLTPNHVLLEVNIRSFNKKATKSNLIYFPPSLIIIIILPSSKVITSIAGIPPTLEGEVGYTVSMGKTHGEVTATL